MYMYLQILFADDRYEVHLIKRFTNLSQTKSNFYYYEKPVDERGKGTSIPRSEIKCFEITTYNPEVIHGEQE